MFHMSKKSFKKSYSQCGEDVIVDFILENFFDINKPYYLDLGAHDPFFISNTAFFDLKGCHGVCIEADPELFLQLKNKRKNAKCVNVGVSVSEGRDYAKFYIMDQNSLNTFSKEEALRYVNECGNKITREVDIKVLSYNDIVEFYCLSKPNFVSIDVEGLDYDIVKSMNLTTRRPEVICVETLSYANEGNRVKNLDLIQYLEEMDYFRYADTYINSIFVDAKLKRF